MLEILLTLAVVISTSITIVMILLPSRYVKPDTSSRGHVSKGNLDISVQVLVLGDIGRSPRMQYHAMSIARHGGRAYLIGYNGTLMILSPLSRLLYRTLDSPVHPAITNDPLISIAPLAVTPSIIPPWLPFIIAGPLKVLFQIYTVLRTLSYTVPPTRFLLVQNPPSIPVLAIAYLVSFLRNTHLIVDWHNYGYTILSNKLPTTHPLVRISRAYEHALGRRAPTANFTVTHAMAKQLKSKPWNIRSQIFTLHDRPDEIFQPVTSIETRRNFFQTLKVTQSFGDSIIDGTHKLLVSSTSWTADEDFGLLLDALVGYSKNDFNPPVLAIITGKGPDKAKYMDRIAALTKDGRLKKVDIKSAWLSMADYAMLLACADLGVCLHKSSSGVDLPMKVVDMFGAGLPVAGYSGYESWPELVQEGVNGRGFETAIELKDVLEDLFRQGTKKLKLLKDGAMREGSRRWDHEWDDVAARVFGFID